MTPEQIKKLRENNGFSQQAVADMLNGALDRKYTTGTVSAWENGKRPIPEHVSVFLAELGLSSSLPPRDDDTPIQPLDGGGDTAPEQDGPPVQGQAVLVPGGGYSRVCEELFSMIAMAVGMTGAAIGNDALRRDGQIIEADKKALGAAYGKLAETNETFRRMLTGMTTSGAWLEVCLVTGTTAGTIWRNHSEQRVLTVVPREPDVQADAA